MDGESGGGVFCLLEVPEGCSCQVNILQCTLEGIEVVADKYFKWKSVLLFGERSCIYSSCGRQVFFCRGLRYWFGVDV